tara:strand:+ start:3912 stop:4466 length:555 start_codon:yes stop_codon:yes gene_type:complete
MAIEIQIGTPPVEEEEKPVQASMALNVRKSLDGNIMIFDHEEIDIVVMPSKNKVVAFPKDLMSDTVYEAQDRLFFYLAKNGVVTAESIQGGNVYGSLEATVATPLEESVDQSQVAVFSIGKFILEEKPFFKTYKEYEEDIEDGLTNPDDEDSTELGDVEHKEMQGSMRPGFLRGAYGLNYMYRY